MRTLRNAITSGRIAHAFVFAGSRGCGKTTTARILARALNCAKGPTADPCGECDACIEIAQGRDIDVLEIDAASHTGIDNIREVVIAGLAISPVRDRYKVFIIDEVHQLSPQSFNALLKSIEEPPAHVVFMMATTELHKIPDTILSRAQVFEFRTIPAKAIAAQLRKIADAEKIDVSSDALALIARAAEGSMRDAQSAFDQVIAFAGQTITVEDVSTVLGLVGRDLLFDIIEAVIDEDGPRAFALADRAVESGHDLRLVCRELSGVVRDLMIVSVDPGRAGETEVAEGERVRLTQLAGRFSREDLMRAFDVLTKAEQDIRVASQPRYHFEMALLRWMHVRKLVPLTELMDQLGGGAPTPATRGVAPTARPAAASASPKIVAPREGGSSPTRAASPSSQRPAPADVAPFRCTPGISPGCAVCRCGCVGCRRNPPVGAEGPAARGDSRRQDVFLQHRGGAGAEDRGDRGSGDIHVPARASRAAGAVRGDRPIARIDGRTAGRAQDDGDRRRGCVPAVHAGPGDAVGGAGRGRTGARRQGRSVVVARCAGAPRCIPGTDPGRGGDVTREINR